ncbi:hypothetical protein BBW65_03770 [Helicobacter enhydrae]|uniref:Rhodanese domain-containing protein n=1 Tax=Helicobacter enhydrae TaxID=222136 RepID=A0A1B1U5D3_9HELI|nr:rhodanese-like domain-containing protein [Helicobacter enhydrae]ANV97969.1 hypothetical protein BBW65_03770 [Helicobacter enhydrae]
MKAIFSLVFLASLFIGYAQDQKSDDSLTQALSATLDKKTPPISQELQNKAQALIQSAQKDGFKWITAEKLHTLLQNHQVVVIDTSAVGQYLLGHLENAKTLEFAPYDHTAPTQWNSRDSQEVFLKKLGADKEAILVFYDEGKQITPTRATSACIWAHKLGYKHIYQLVGGLKAWKEANYPITQSKPHCCR